MRLKQKPKMKFKRKQGQATQASQGMSDYHAAAHATRQKTARLRKLREEKEAADAKATKRRSVKSAKQLDRMHEHLRRRRHCMSSSSVRGELSTRALLQQFQQSGHGDKANSWVWTGPNPS
jgi:uncharacterized protein YidB (DUF937 family)